MATRGAVLLTWAVCSVGERPAVDPQFWEAGVPGGTAGAASSLLSLASEVASGAGTGTSRCQERGGTPGTFCCRDERRSFVLWRNVTSLADFVRDPAHFLRAYWLVAADLSNCLNRALLAGGSLWQDQLHVNVPSSQNRSRMVSSHDPPPIFHFDQYHLDVRPFEVPEEYQDATPQPGKQYVARQAGQRYQSSVYGVCCLESFKIKLYVHRELDIRTGNREATVLRCVKGGMLKSLRFALQTSAYEAPYVDAYPVRRRSRGTLRPDWIDAPDLTTIESSGNEFDFSGDQYLNKVNTSMKGNLDIKIPVGAVTFLEEAELLRVVNGEANGETRPRAVACMEEASTNYYAMLALTPQPGKRMPGNEDMKPFPLPLHSVLHHTSEKIVYRPLLDGSDPEIVVLRFQCEGPRADHQPWEGDHPGEDANFSYCFRPQIYSPGPFSVIGNHFGGDYVVQTMSYFSARRPEESLIFIAESPDASAESGAHSSPAGFAAAWAAALVALGSTVGVT